MHKLYGDGLLYGLLQQRQSLINAPSQGIRQAQGQGKRGEEELRRPRLVDAEATLERGDGLAQVSLAQIQKAEGRIRLEKTIWTIDRLGNPYPFSAVGNPFGKHP